MSVISNIRRIGAEFKEIPDEELCEWIHMFAPLVSKKQFGKLYELVLAYVVCHKLKMSGKGEELMGGALGSMGAIGAGFLANSVSDGGTSISLASGAGRNTQSDSEFTLTVYGQQYLQLRKTLIVPIHVSGEM